ncbi:hypothetical protein FVB9288_02332 [Flavobacterium sp. CECT 9288]|uniref:DUF3667 domain-containing protein n=1 Tax=Flavobacterium sp. CECT 9288 TaxID=2845819 RepID=UPI001E7C56E1|nr:hypothetical protein FVB9288_02332 [Flavobacterium sp. CECT 9288]
MENKKCLNCNSTVNKNFCPNCGQKTSTHRFTFQHFLHDFLHGVFHLDKGFFFTLKKLFTRPGHSIREYLHGSRVNYFNAFTLIIILATISHLITEYFKMDQTVLYEKKNQINGYIKIARDHDKIIRLFRIPFYAFASYLLFKKSKQNYIEHLILNLYVASGVIIITIFGNVFMECSNNIITLKIINYLIVLLILIYFYCFFYQYFSVFGYKKYALIIKCTLISFLILFIMSFLNNFINNVGLMHFK